jgi:hypothetical protein
MITGVWRNNIIEEDVSMKRPNVLWITALILGWLFDFLFWKHNHGVSFAIYVVLCLAGGFTVLRMDGLKPHWRSLLLLLPIAFFAAMSFIRQEPLSLFLAYAFTLFSLGVLAFTYLGGRWPAYSLSDYVANFFKLAGSSIARPFVFIGETRRRNAEAGPRSGAKRIWPILRGVLIAIPIIAIFAALLASADLIFAQKLDEIVKLFRLEKLPEYIFRAVYILIGAYLLAGVLLHAATRSQDEKLIGVEKPLVPPFLGFTDAAIVLGSVTLLFAAFVVIQFQYFFGGQANIHMDGYTFAEYARRGFGELVTVAFFSLLLYLGLSAIVKRETPGTRWGFSGLGVVMVTLVGVMLVSAFQRLLLYEAAYGFTRLRTYTHIFMIWLGILLAAVVVLDILRKERAFALAALAAALGFAVTLSLLNVDAFIVRRNVARAPLGEGLDVPHLASLSADAVPALAALYADPALPALTRDAVGAALVCRNEVQYGRSDENWRAFTFSGWLAGRTMDALQGTLSGYRVTEEGGPAKVLTPGQVMYECWSYMD